MNRRTLALATIAAVMAGIGIADRASRDGADSVTLAVADAPQLPPDDAVDTTWYCAGGTATPGGAADAVVIVANPSPRRVSGTLTVVASDPKVGSKAQPVTIEAGAVAVFPYQQVLTAPYAAAMLELRGGGGVAVEHSVSGPLGADVAPCATAGSSRWYFADGGTTRDASDVYTLFNPFPDDAIVDISFSTEDGRLTPNGFQALVVPKNSVLPIDVGTQVIRRRAVSASIVARRGRIVAERIQTYDGSAGRRGLALVLGAPAPSETWFFPHGLTNPGFTERYQLYNPSREEAVVDVEITLDAGSVEPIEVTIPAGGRHSLLMNAETRLPAGVGHSVAVRSANGVPVVAERSLDGARPSAVTGLASTLGAPQESTTWVFPAGLATARVEEYLAVFNPGDRAATVRVTTFTAGRSAPVPRLEQVEVGPGRRFAVRLNDLVGNAPSLPIVVTASEPVVAERSLARVRANGISAVMGIRAGS